MQNCLGPMCNVDMCQIIATLAQYMVPFFLYKYIYIYIYLICSLSKKEKVQINSIGKVIQSLFTQKIDWYFELMINRTIIQSV